MIQFIQLKENCSKHEALVKAAALLNGNLPAAPSAAKLFIEANIAKESVLAQLFKYFAQLGLEKNL